MCKSWRASPLPTPRFLPSRDDGDESSAHGPGFGEKRAFHPGNRAFSAQRPGLGEICLFHALCPQIKPQVKSLPFSPALPSQDHVPAELQPNSPKQGRCARSGRVPGSGARFSPKPRRCAAAALPSRDDVAPSLRIVPALERNALFCRETGRFLHNVPAREKSAFSSGLTLQQNRRSGARGSRPLSQAGTLFRPNSPKQGRCAGSGRIPASGARFSPKPRRCAAATLPSWDLVQD